MVDSEHNLRKETAYRLAVYCGSKPGEKWAYQVAAQTVGHWIASLPGELVYGGGHSGLMGVVADACLSNGGRVFGVIPQALCDRELAHTGCTELHVVPTMSERKQMMLSRADGFVALPGGIGTLEEIFEAWTLSMLGYNNKAVGLLNVDGFYDPLLAQLQQCNKLGFLPSESLSRLVVETDALTLCERLRSLAA